MHGAMCVVLLTTCWEITIKTAEKCAPPNTANIQVIIFPATVLGQYVPYPIVVLIVNAKKIDRERRWD